MAPDLWGGLELAINTPVALLDSPGVPGQIEVKEICAMGLEVQPLPGGISGEKDAKWVLRRIGVEPLLDFLAPSAAREPVDYFDALVRSISALDRLLENRFQVPLRAFAILGEDEHPAVVPLPRCALGLPAEGRKFAAEVVADPVYEPQGLRFGQLPRFPSN